MKYQPVSIIKNAKLASGIFRLILQTEPGVEVLPGQFVQIKTNARHTLLPRPISVSDYDFSTGKLTLVIQEKGPGTAAICSLLPGDKTEILWPLGNGLKISSESKKIWLFGAGLGLAPMLYAARKWAGEGRSVTALCGFRNAGLAYYIDEMKALCNNVTVATDDGSLGVGGTVTEALRHWLAAHDPAADELAVYSCGPEPMMRATADQALARGYACELALERHMACGMGTCQSCVVKLRDTNDQGWRFHLCCTDGPVFDAREILW